MQKKIIRASVILLALVVLAGCQPRYQGILLPPGIFNPSNPGTSVTYTVTIDYNDDGTENRILTDQKTLVKPADPVWDDDHEFAYWTINGVKVEDSLWGSALSGNVTLTAAWISIYENLAAIKELSGVIKDTGDGHGMEAISDVSFDGNGLVKIQKWQDMNTAVDLSIKGVIFEHGLSIHAENPESTTITIAIENCEIHPCNQLAWKNGDEPKPYDTSNSGDGLCLGIDSSYSNNPSAPENENRGDVIINVLNNKLIGENDPTVSRNGFKSLDDGDDQSAKSRGNGVSLGNQSGGTVHLKSAFIEGNTFTGLRGHAIQLYEIAGGTSVQIIDNTFESWGINKNNLGRESGIEDYAIRGNLKNGDFGTITLSGNDYAEIVNGDFDVSNRKVKIDNWDGVIQ